MTTYCALCSSLREISSSHESIRHPSRRAIAALGGRILRAQLACSHPKTIVVKL